MMNRQDTNKNSLSRKDSARRLRGIGGTLLARWVLVVLAGIAPGFATAATIDFESLPGMPNSPGSIVPAGSRLSDQFQSTTGAVFSSAVGYVAVVVLGPGHAQSPPNGIGGVDSADRLSYGSPITVTFFDTLNPSLLAVTDFVSIRGDKIAVSGTATLEAFDIAGGSLGSITANDIAGGLTLALSQSGIHSIRISETSGTVAFDDLTFNPVTAAVPLPASLLLFGTGLVGLVGNLIRRKKSESL
jgi:PEP-CTERM motif